jgi:microcystin-dependent protein
MIKKRFERVDTKDEILEKIQANIEKAFLSQPFEKVSTIRAKLYANQRNVIEHKLELKPSGFFISNINSPGIIWVEPGVEISTAPTKFINIWTDYTQEYEITFFIGPNPIKQYNVQSTGGAGAYCWPTTCIDHLLVCCIDNYDVANMSVVTVDNSLTVCCSINLCTGGSLTLPENIMYRGAIPIGGIIPTLPHLTGAYSTTCVTSPDSNGFVLANGQTINYPSSPMHGVTIPNINNDIFIKASTCSGYTGGLYNYTLVSCQIPTHNHTACHTHSVGLTSLPHCHYIDTQSVASHSHNLSTYTCDTTATHQHYNDITSWSCDVGHTHNMSHCHSIQHNHQTSCGQCLQLLGLTVSTGGTYLPTYYGSSYTGGLFTGWVCNACNGNCSGTCYQIFSDGPQIQCGTCMCTATTACTGLSHGHCVQGWTNTGGVAHAHWLRGSTDAAGSSVPAFYTCGSVYSGSYDSLTHGHILDEYTGNTGNTGLGCSITIIPCFISAVYLIRII